MITEIQYLRNALPEEVIFMRIHCTVVTRKKKVASTPTAVRDTKSETKSKVKSKS